MNPRYETLFEPVAIGPVTAPNRFYQVPHASGMTEANPRTRAAFRGMKAEGGWGVVSTGAVSTHPSCDDSPLPFARLWDDNDVRSHALTTESIHAHGALAAIELWHGGAAVMNRTSRTPPLSPSGIPWAATHVGFMGHQRPRIMGEDDIRDVIDWQATASRRARSAGFDIIYVYAGMGYLGYEFLLPEYNRRTDAYGGSLANRARFVIQLIEATKAAVGTDCAVALRVSLEELRRRPSESHESEAHELVELMSEVPDLWDVKMDSSPTDCGASRFRPEGAHEPTIDFVKRHTKRPVVGVGRFTSPDTMVSQVKRGVLDLIGGARPSISDPFLPSKLREGREDDIRECIGCNICISSWHDSVPVRCTQNATAGEEWRRGWHPERFAPATEKGPVLVVGGGPAGLEAALVLARRGVEVSLADRSEELGGRLCFETRLPGLAAWDRVRTYRLHALRQMDNVALYPGSDLTTNDVLAMEHPHVAIATGARWTRSLWSRLEIPTGRLEHSAVFTPDDVANGRLPEGPVLVYDFDNFYLGGVLAEFLAEQGLDVHYATPAGHVSAWTIMTNEQPFVHEALQRRGIGWSTLSVLTGFDGATATLEGVFDPSTRLHACQSVLIVGHRSPRDELARDLAARRAEWPDAGLRSVQAIGDARAPGALVHAVHSGHEFGREFDAGPDRLWLRDQPLTGDPPGPAYS